MRLDSFSDALRIGGPLLAIGFAAGALRAASLRTADPRRRRALLFAWVATLIFGVPLWLFLATALRLL